MHKWSSSKVYPCPRSTRLCFRLPPHQNVAAPKRKVWNNLPGPYFLPSGCNVALQDVNQPGRGSTHFRQPPVYCNG
ncbi:unnamed protein product, partial [Iphiclides podalirius]